jgi:proteasome beta subunit
MIPDQSRPGDRGSVAEPVATDGGVDSGGTLVATTTRDGVLLAADERTTRGTVVRSEDVRKLAQVHPTGAMGATDDLGTAGAFVRSIRAEVDRYGTQRGEPMDLTALATVAAEELRSSDAPDVTFVLGGVDPDGPHVFALDRTLGVTAEPYVAVGTGRQVALGVLETAAASSLSMADARRLAGRALESAAERDVRTGGGASVAEITADGVEIREFDAIADLR